MSQQKVKGPKKVLFARVPLAMYVYAHDAAGEDSLPVFLTKLLAEHQKQASKICTQRNTQRTIGADIHV